MAHLASPSGNRLISDVSADYLIVPSVVVSPASLSHGHAMDAGVAVAPMYPADMAHAHSLASPGFIRNIKLTPASVEHTHSLAGASVTKPVDWMEVTFDSAVPGIAFSLGTRELNMAFSSRRPEVGITIRKVLNV